MGALLNFLKYTGLYSDEEGTIFGGKAGNGVLKPITFIIPAPKPTPPAPQGQAGQAEAGHHPSYAWEPIVDYISDRFRGLRERRPYRKLRLAYV